MAKRFLCCLLGHRFAIADARRSQQPRFRGLWVYRYRCRRCGKELA